MALTRSVKLYGFGSFFQRGVKSPRDVDLLIVHQEISRASMEFAIRSKSLIASEIPNCHVVVLSEREERQIDFVRRSDAVFVEEIFDKSVTAQVRALWARICARRGDAAAAR